MLLTPPEGVGLELDFRYFSDVALHEGKRNEL